MKRHQRTIACLNLSFLLAVLSACTPANRTPEQSIRPGVNSEYKTTPIEKWVERFESESREIFKERDRILRAADIRSGMAVADIGAGSGFFTEMFARQVAPKGRVYAVDITPGFIERIDARAKELDLSNITGIVCSDKDAMLPHGSVDVAFVCDTYHHFEFPAQTLASIHRALKPGGMLVVVDFDRAPGKTRQWVLDHVRAGKEEVRGEIAANGFKLLDEPPTPFLTENYMLRFRKK